MYGKLHIILISKSKLEIEIKTSNSKSNFENRNKNSKLKLEIKTRKFRLLKKIIGNNLPGKGLRPAAMGDKTSSAVYSLGN